MRARFSICECAIYNDKLNNYYIPNVFWVIEEYVLILLISDYDYAKLHRVGTWYTSNNSMVIWPHANDCHTQWTAYGTGVIKQPRE